MSPDYAGLYEALYKTGYHNLTVGSNAFGGFWVNPTILLRQILDTAKDIDTVLDVGCSHGMAVAALHDFGKAASGMDVSTTAVALATKHSIRKYVEHSRKNIFARKVAGQPFCDVEAKRHGSHCFRLDHPDRPRSVEVINASRRCVGPCFQVGSALQIPWPDNSFDAILSTDVLEHIAESDVPTLVREFCRVSKKWLFLMIASKKEANKESLKTARSAFKDSSALRHVESLHITTRDSDWWLAKFQEQAPYKLIARSERGGITLLKTREGSCGTRRTHTRSSSVSRGRV